VKFETITIAVSADRTWSHNLTRDLIPINSWSRQALLPHLNHATSINFTVGERVKVFHGGRNICDTLGSGLSAAIMSALQHSLWPQTKRRQTNKQKNGYCCRVKPPLLWRGLNNSSTKPSVVNKLNISVRTISTKPLQATFCNSDSCVNAMSAVLCKLTVQMQLWTIRALHMHTSHLAAAGHTASSCLQVVVYNLQH